MIYDERESKWLDSIVVAAIILIWLFTEYFPWKEVDILADHIPILNSYRDMMDFSIPLKTDKWVTLQKQSAGSISMAGLTSPFKPTVIIFLFNILINILILLESLELLQLLLIRGLFLIGWDLIYSLIIHWFIRYVQLKILFYNSNWSNWSVWIMCF